MNLRRLALGVILTSVVGALIFVALPIGRELLGDGVAWLRAAGGAGKVAATTLMILGVPFGLPALWLAALLGYLFGFGGIALALPAMTAGATLAYTVARWVLAEDITRFVSKRPKWRALGEAVEFGGWQLVALLRLWAPHNILNLVLGAARVRSRDFILGTFIGAAPSIALAAIGGALAPNAEQLWNSLQSLGPWAFVLVGLGVAGLVVAMLWIKKAAKRAFDRAQAQNAQDAGGSRAPSGAPLPE